MDSTDGTAVLPYVRLWQNVLLDGLCDIFWGTPRSRRACDVVDGGHAERRWYRENSDFVGSFAWICDLLGKDFRKIRLRVEMLALTVGKKRHSMTKAAFTSLLENAI